MDPKLVTRLKRIEGQIAGIRRMAESDRDCVDLLLQISAVQGALSQAGKLLLKRHIESCVTDVLATGGERDRREKIDELMDVFSRYAR